MAEKKKLNPFYVLLVIVGVAFCVTASAFGLMTLRGVQSSGPVIQDLDGSENSGPHPLMTLMETHGMSIIMVELVLLGIFTFAAIGLDQHWINQETRAEEARKANKENQSIESADTQAEEEQGVTTQ